MDVIFSVIIERLFAVLHSRTRGILKECTGSSSHHLTICDGVVQAEAYISQILGICTIKVRYGKV